MEAQRAWRTDLPRLYDERFGELEGLGEDRCDGSYKGVDGLLEYGEGLGLDRQTLARRLVCQLRARLTKLHTRLSDGSVFGSFLANVGSHLDAFCTTFGAIFTISANQGLGATIARSVARPCFVLGRYFFCS